MPRSGREVVRLEGALLWPEREGRAELDAAKIRLGSYGYACQYLQNPIARGGNLFNNNGLDGIAIIRSSTWSFSPGTALIRLAS